MEEYRKEKMPEIVIKNSEEIKAIFDEISSEIEGAIVEDNIAEVKIILLRIRNILKEFSGNIISSGPRFSRSLSQPDHSKTLFCKTFYIIC